MLTICSAVVFFACYLLFAGRLGASELGLAVPAALLATGFSVAMRRLGRRRLALRPTSWPRVLLRPLAGLGPDALRVGGALIATIPRRPRLAQGVFRHHPFPATGDDPVDAGRRALATLSLSFAPNGYVADATDLEGGLLVHRLRPSSRDADRDLPL